MARLTAAQIRNLREASEQEYISAVDDYRPTSALAAKGLLVRTSTSFGYSTFAITERGRAALAEEE